jgi:hypothetical protein
MELRHLQFEDVNLYRLGFIGWLFENWDESYQQGIFKPAE